MKKSNSKKLSWQDVVLTLLVYVSRFGFLSANFSMVGSFGFFTQNLLLYFFVIILFDVVKGGFYQGFIFTYLAFFVYWFYGRLATTVKRKLILLPFASFLFFLISNFGVWLNWYPQTVSGLINCYLLAVPFYKYTLFSDLFFGYSVIMFQLLKQRSIFNKTKLLPQMLVNH